MKVKFIKLNKEAIIPKARLIGDVGLDLTVNCIVERNEYIEYRFGVKLFFFL